MKRVNYVCFEHRTHSRSWGGSSWCPVDGQPMVGVGDRWRIPKRRDDLGWKALLQFYNEIQRRLNRRYDLRFQRAILQLDKWSKSR